MQPPGAIIAGYRATPCGIPGEMAGPAVGNSIERLGKGPGNRDGEGGRNDNNVSLGFNSGAEHVVVHFQIELAEVVQAERAEVHGRCSGAEHKADAVQAAGLYASHRPGSHDGAPRRREGTGEQGQGLKDVGEAHAEDQPAVGGSESRPKDHDHDDC